MDRLLYEFRKLARVSYVADAPSPLIGIFTLGDLSLFAACDGGDIIRLNAHTASDHAWIRTGSQGESDFNSAQNITIFPGSDSNVLVYHSAADQVVTLQWASWQNGIGKDCQFWGTALLSP